MDDIKLIQFLPYEIVHYGIKTFVFDSRIELYWKLQECSWQKLIIQWQLISSLVQSFRSRNDQLPFPDDGTFFIRRLFSKEFLNSISF